MSMLKNLKSEDGIATEKDSVGNGGPLDSNLYKLNIALAYLNVAASEAMGLVLHLKTEEGREVRQTLWMTSGKDKGCKNYYVDKEGNKQYLPGFNHANSLALLTVGKEIGDLETEEKVVKLYSAEAKAEVPTKVQVFVDLLGQDIIAGIIKQTVDKTQKNDAGVYIATGETRDENDIDKFFRAKDNMTTAEIRAKAEQATFIDTWSDKWTGVTKMKAKGAGNGTGTAGAPKGAAANSGTTKKPAQSLFA